MIRLLLILISSFFVLSCQTVSLVTKVDVRRKSIELQSQADPGSAVLALQKEGALEGLEKDLLVRIKKNNKDVDSLLNLSQIKLAQGRYDEAEKYCRQALTYDLDNRDARIILAQTYYRRGYLDMADILLNSLGSKADKNSIALNLKGLISLSRDQPSQALFLFKEALKYNSGDVATRMNLGVLYIHFRQISQAAVEFERVLKTMPHHIDAKMHLAVIKASRGQYQQAEELYKDVLNVDAKNALAMYNLAVLEEKRKNYDDSLDYLKVYLESDYAKQQRNKEVFAMIERLKTKKEMQGEKVSDSDIKQLADQIRSNQEYSASQVEEKKSSPTPSTKVVKQEKRTLKPEKATAKKAIKKQTKPKYNPEDNSIEALERELSE